MEFFLFLCWNSPASSIWRASLVSSKPWKEPPSTAFGGFFSPLGPVKWVCWVQRLNPENRSPEKGPLKETNLSSNTLIIPYKTRLEKRCLIKTGGLAVRLRKNFSISRENKHYTEPRRMRQFHPQGSSGEKFYNCLPLKGLEQ